MGEDYELWLRLVFEYGFKTRMITEYLASYRLHSSQISSMAYERGLYDWTFELLVKNLQTAYPDVYGDDYIE